MQVSLNKRKSVPSRVWETMAYCGKSKRCATKSDDRRTCNKSDAYLVAGFDFPMSRDTYGLLTVPQLPHDMTQNGHQEEVEEEGVENGWRGRHIQQSIARHANGNKVNSQTNEKLLFALPFERKTARKCGSYKWARSGRELRHPKEIANSCSSYALS